MLTGAYYALSPISFIIVNPCNILFVLFSLKFMFSLLTICQVTTYSLSWITFRPTHHPFLPLSANYTAQYPHLFPQACLKRSYDVISGFLSLWSVTSWLCRDKIPEVAKTKVSKPNRYSLSKLRLHAPLKWHIQTPSHMSTSRCGNICISRGGKSTKIFYSSKSTITLLKFYLSTSKSTSLKIYSSKSKK